MNSIPLQPIPNQILTTVINGDRYAIEINTRNDKLYITLIINDVTIVVNRALLSYAPVTDIIMLVDTQGLENPNYAELGTRFLLMVWEP